MGVSYMEGNYSKKAITQFSITVDMPTPQPYNDDVRMFSPKSDRTPNSPHIP
jgi:hypothetical protein